VGMDSVTIELRYDVVADAAYIYLKQRIESGEVAETIPADVSAQTPVAGGVNLDFDEAGRLLGIEILGAGHILGEEIVIRLRRNVE
jgi:uncharacterized protein YuzE